MLTVKFKKLTPEAVVPSRGTVGSAGFDLTTIENVEINSHGLAVIKTGIAAAIPLGYVGLIKPRSSVFRAGFDCDGTIDSDYRGEIMVQLRNTLDMKVTIEKGSRIAQLVVVPYFSSAEEVLVLNETDRGGGGFGSTGR